MGFEFNQNPLAEALKKVSQRMAQAGCLSALPLIIPDLDFYSPEADGAVYYLYDRQGLRALKFSQERKETTLAITDRITGVRKVVQDYKIVWVITRLSDNMELAVDFDLEACIHLFIGQHIVTVLNRMLAVEKMRSLASD